MYRMKIISTCLIFVFFLTNIYGNDLLEEDFKSRIFSYAKEAQISESQNNIIWVKGDSPDSESASTYELLGKLIKRKIDKIEFIEIAPDMIKAIDEDVFKVEGVYYTSNMKPYSFVKFYYQDVPEGKVYASQTLVGIGNGDNKLYIMGLKKVDEK